MEVFSIFCNDPRMELELLTERLRLTPYEIDDFDFAVEMWTDPAVVRYICWVLTEEEVRREMPNVIKRGGNGGIGLWCVADRKTGEKLGESSLWPLPTDRNDVDFSLIVMGQMPDAEIAIGYFFKPSVWGRGYASEVCERMLQFAFQEVELNEVVATINEENVASKKVLEKCGLLSSGRMRCYGEDSPIYRISRDQWNALQQR